MGIKITRGDIREAINELAAVPGGIPALFIKKTRDTIDRPLQMILSQSLDESSVTELQKTAYVAPQH